MRPIPPSSVGILGTVLLLALVATQGHTAFGAGDSQSLQTELLLPPKVPEFPISFVFNPQGQMFLAYSDSSIRTVIAGKKEPLRYASTSLDFSNKGAGYLYRGMDFDREGNLYVTDGTRIYRIDLQGKLTLWMAGFEDAMDLKVDPAGNVYVAEAQQCAVYKVTPGLAKTRLIDRGHKFRMREMVSGIAFDRRFQNLYLAERVTGQILRYPLVADGSPGAAEVVASDIVSLRSIVVDDRGGVLANIDFPILVYIDPQGQQRQFVIPNNMDFSMGRMALGQAEGDRDSLYVPTKLGVVRISNLKGRP
jgi:sugar lactone lactonase YvrE